MESRYYGYTVLSAVWFLRIKVTRRPTARHYLVVLLRFVEYFFCGSSYCGNKVCGFSWIVNSHGNNGKALRVNSVEIFLWRIYGLPLWIYEGCLLRFGLGLRCETKVLSRSLLSILKGRYLLKRRKVTVTSLNVWKFLKKSYRIKY